MHKQLEGHLRILPKRVNSGRRKHLRNFCGAIAVRIGGGRRRTASHSALYSRCRAADLDGRGWLSCRRISAREPARAGIDQRTVTGRRLAAFSMRVTACGDMRGLMADKFDSST
jgi:hypothetical protein